MSTSASSRLWARLQSALTGAHALPKLQMQCLGQSSGSGSTHTVRSLATSSSNKQLNAALSSVVSSMSRLHTAGICSMSAQHSSLILGGQHPSLRHCKHLTTNSSRILPERAAVVVAAAAAGSNTARSKPARSRKVTPLNLLTQQELKKQRPHTRTPHQQQQLQPQQPSSHSSNKLQQPAPHHQAKLPFQNPPGLLQEELQHLQQQQQQHLAVKWPFSSHEPSQQEIYQHLKSVGSRLSDEQLSAVSSYLSELNQEQWEAVLCEAQHLRLIAGPGSGKTRTITARVAWCLANNTPANQILVITFTRKAAGELQERMKSLIGEAMVKRLRPRTFHRFCNEVLRRYEHKSDVGDFGIATQDEVYNIIKGIVFPDGPPSKKSSSRGQSKEAKVDLDGIPINTVLVGIGPPRKSVDLSDVDAAGKVKDPIDMYRSAISRLKNFVPEIEGRSGSDLIQETSAAGYHLITPELQPQIAYVYDRYQEHMRKANMLDFDDMLHRFFHLVKNDDEVRHTLHRRYQHVLVDESQDTNHCQFGLVKQITGPQAKLLMVGDPDQAIYGFRGANSTLLSQVFLKQYPGTADTRYLSRNYRSRSPIVQVADIVRGQYRGSSSLFKPAECVRGHESDHTVVLVQAENQHDEMERMIQQVERWHGVGYLWGDMALLYRTRQAAKFMYQKMVAANIPCNMPLGKDFWDSIEVKTAIALMKCLVRPAEAGDMIKQRLVKKSVVTVPIMAGLGDTTITNLEKHLKTHSSDSSLSSCLLESCFTGPAQQAEPSQVLEELAPAWHPPAGFDGFKTKTARAAVARLRGLVVLGRSAVESLPPAGVLKMLLDESGIRGTLQRKLAVDELDKDARRQTDNLGVLLELAENIDAYHTIDADEEAEDLDEKLSLSSMANESDSSSSSSGDDNGGGGGILSSSSSSSSAISKNQPQMLQQYRSNDSISMLSHDLATTQQQQSVGMQLLRAFYDFCVLQGEDDENDIKSQKVQILTMHSSKGKEFPCVGVMRVHEGMMPCIHKDDTTPNAIEQERNTLYVSLTRAKDHLVVYWPAQMVHFNNSTGREYVRQLRPSEFIVPVLAAVAARRLPGVVHWKHSKGRSTLVAGFPVGAVNDELTS